jgi:hypothetical protein
VCRFLSRLFFHLHRKAVLPLLSRGTFQECQIVTLIEAVLFLQSLYHRSQEVVTWTRHGVCGVRIKESFSSRAAVKSNPRVIGDNSGDVSFAQFPSIMRFVRTMVGALVRLVLQKGKTNGRFSSRPKRRSYQVDGWQNQGGDGTNPTYLQ